ncbi:MAG TPA: DUF1566 domain-containing protein [Candidatus Solibacter sp.]|nr:DUF1566 domain-containing protein [Candidatus Solibacter sp.]
MGPMKLLLAMVGLAMLTACGGGTGSAGETDPPVPLPTDTISGTVTFKGAPLPGTAVTLFDTNWNTIHQVATTDANGNFSFSGLGTSGNVPTDYQLFANKTDYGFYPSVGSGAKITRFDYTGQFVGNGVTDIAIYFTVIDYIALPDAPLSGANFTAYEGSNPLVTLASTGQIASYANGDDGSQHKGVAWPGTRFVDNQDGTVADNLTGLVWLKNAGCFSPTLWSNAVTEISQLASGSCGLTDGSSAGQWRLPNLNELESLVDVSASNPALPAGNPFTNVSTAIYWSSTSYFGGETGSPDAWSIRFGDGRYMNDSSSNVKATSNNAVWAVKGSGGGSIKLQATGMYDVFTSGDDGSFQAGVPATYPRWNDNGNGTVTDTVTGLIWLKMADCIRQPWSAAVAAVNALASGQCGLTDGSVAGSWRMPNRNEMQSLSDRMENNHADFFDQTYTWKASQTLYRSPIFTNMIAFEYYWTSTTDASDTSEAWTVFSCDFGVYDIPKMNLGYTLAVR